MNCAFISLLVAALEPASPDAATGDLRLAFAVVGTWALAGLLLAVLSRVLSRLVPTRRIYTRAAFDRWLDVRVPCYTVGRDIVESIKNQSRRFTLRSMLQSILLPFIFALESALAIILVCAWLFGVSAKPSVLGRSQIREDMLREKLLGLVNGNLSGSIFELAPSEFVGQLGRVSDIVLAAPRQHREIFKFLTRGADARDLDWVLQEPASSPADGVPNAEQPEAGARVSFHVQRRLDAFLIDLTIRWRLRGTVALLVLGIVAVWAESNALATSGVMAATAQPVVVGGLIVGCFAVVCGDLLSRLLPNVAAAE